MRKIGNFLYRALVCYAFVLLGYTAIIGHPLSIVQRVLVAVLAFFCIVNFLHDSLDVPITMKSGKTYIVPEKIRNMTIVNKKTMTRQVVDF